ncbi:hypothetical protein WHZ78_02360 [Bradyrhizobium symbiodeficiens]|uniref:hypothetical protein n=1 Tax=Bradyrhizobium symbiodeficiens TaxID=1404367 RepID=UPI0030D2A792
MRFLNPVSWAVKEYDFDTGEWLLIRGMTPEAPAFTPPDIELAYYDGKQRVRFILHRRREGQLRREKIAEALAKPQRPSVYDLSTPKFSYHCVTPDVTPGAC